MTATARRALLRASSTNFFCGPERKVTGKGQNQQAVYSAVGKQFELLWLQREELGRLLGREDAQRVRVKGDGHGNSVHLRGARAHQSQELTVSEMDTVKSADGDDTGSVIGSGLFERVEDLHAMWLADSQ